jgi:hypothetical protein
VRLGHGRAIGPRAPPCKPANVAFAREMTQFRPAPAREALKAAHPIKGGGR